MCRLKAYSKTFRWIHEPCSLTRILAQRPNEPLLNLAHIIYMYIYIFHTWICMDRSDWARLGTRFLTQNPTLTIRLHRGEVLPMRSHRSPYQKTSWFPLVLHLRSKLDVWYILVPQIHPNLGVRLSAAVYRKRDY